LTGIKAVGAAIADTASVIEYKGRMLVGNLQRNFTMLVLSLCAVMVFLAILAMRLAGEI